jgi:hypothetical protein
MPLDAEGIHQYVGSELAAPADVMLNRLAGSTSTQVKALRERTVRSFASAAARNAAVPVPREGLLTWLEDVNRLEVYTGSAWLVISNDPTYAHSLPGATAGGTAIPMTADSVLSISRQGPRVMGQMSFTAGPAGGPTGVWAIVLPIPVLFPASYRQTIGSGWFANGGPVTLFSLVVGPGGTNAGLLFVQGGAFTGYSAAVAPGATLSAHFTYETA